ncbi:MFS transporter [Priestia endophytica]|uniref:MFS transporter n=1 Tax=Priestia endophytica TaxID=135735 RepID=UPI00227F54F1|nr:MFS transporter [Priestia endophytica]MCY8233109.1 MFS transporter [Priestia endophytica]
MYTLSKNKKFMFLLGAELFSVLGYSMFLLTISWYVVDQLKQPQYMGLLLAIASLPRMFTMIVGGVMADRIQKSKILFSTGIAKTIIIGVLLYAYLDGNLTFSILLVVSFLLGCLDGLFFPALSSLIPVLVEKKELQGANTMIHSSQELVFLIGPVLAGALINYYSFSVTFTISMISMCIYSLLVFPAIIKDEKPLSTGEKSTVFRELQEGYNYVRASPLYIVGIGIIIVINFFIFGPLFLSLPLLAKEEGGTALHLSFLEASFSIGSLVATVILLIVTLRKNRGKLTLYSLITSAILMCVQSNPFYMGLHSNGKFNWFPRLHDLYTNRCDDSRAHRSKNDGKSHGDCFLSSNSLRPYFSDVVFLFNDIRYFRSLLIIWIFYYGSGFFSLYLYEG